ncbi:hypothetical protein [Mycobacterium marinum]|uniref:hypothetical protein n=1 Tax=Mycobacterium marinum TaxID=1781 RepID=UPI002359E4D6|nr:hypothetical protein [Mycobacterium marinum]MDC9004306.1 hypothetical protein [Mycobacterium marinum]
MVSIDYGLQPGISHNSPTPPPVVRMDIAGLSSYDYLLQRVATGRLRLVLLLSPPRTGSTALANALARHGQVDAVVTEPAGQYHLRADARVVETFGLIADAVAAVGPRPASRPAVVLIKETAQHIGPDREWRAWRAIIDKTLVLVRQPALALESLILMTLGLADLLSGGSEARPRLWLSPAGRATCPPATLTCWADFLARLREERDFSGFDEGRLRAHWHKSALFGMPSLQREVWANEARQRRLGDVGDFEPYLGTPPCALSTLPEPLVRPFNDRHFAWSALWDLYDNTPAGDQGVALVDFAAVQADPPARLGALAAFLGLSPRDPSALPPIARSGYDTRCPQLHDVLFREARARSDIAPGNRQPLPIEGFPSWLHPQLRAAQTIYRNLHRELRQP